ncbi:MAG: hypothetical protein MPJ53_02665 [Alphaproteobacteria bacterium]|nr:hypothetical protein [Alphaproteobacteria bacterium]
MTMTATAMARSLALVGADSLTVNGVGSSERYQLMPAGAARKKLNFVPLIREQTTNNGGSVVVSLIKGQLTENRGAVFVSLDVDGEGHNP